MNEMGRKHPGIDDRLIYLPDPADPTEYEAVADALWDLFLTVRNLAPPRSATGCSDHPTGPVDTEAPEGWGRCLLCNQRRRVGRPHVKAATHEPGSVWATPAPPYSHAMLMEIRKTLNNAIQDLDYRSPEQAFQNVADLVHAAFVISRELSRPRTSGCQLHPGAPVDPTAAGGPKCMFCLGRERRQQLGPPAVAVRPSRPVPKTLPRRHRTWDFPAPPAS